MHVQDWINVAVASKHPNEQYAAFFLFHASLQPDYRRAFDNWLPARALFCTYKGERYRCTGVSQAGYIWLTANLVSTEAIDIKVSPDSCTEWSQYAAKYNGQ